MFAHSEVVLNIAQTNSFICTQLNGFKYYLTPIVFYTSFVESSKYYQ